MKYKNNMQLIKIFVCLVLIIITIILRITIPINNISFVLILLLCLYLLINASYYYLKTSIVIHDEQIILNYTDKISMWTFSKVNKITINKKELILIKKVLDKEKAMNVLYIKTTTQEYFLKNMFFEKQINQIVNLFDKH